MPSLTNTNARDAIKKPGDGQDSKLTPSSWLTTLLLQPKNRTLALARPVYSYFRFKSTLNQFMDSYLGVSKVNKGTKNHVTAKRNLFTTGNLQILNPILICKTTNMVALRRCALAALIGLSIYLSIEYIEFFPQLIALLTKQEMIIEKAHSFAIAWTTLSSIALFVAIANKRFKACIIALRIGSVASLLAVCLYQYFSCQCNAVDCVMLTAIIVGIELVRIASDIAIQILILEELK